MTNILLSAQVWRLFRLCIIAASCVLAFSLVNAQSFKPYESPKIDSEQWQIYLATVKGLHGSSRRDVGDIELYFDAKTSVTYSFTKPQHPAHPAWVSRLVVTTTDKLIVRQQGYYAGDETAFNKLLAEYRTTSERLAQSLGLTLVESKD